MLQTRSLLGTLAAIAAAGLALSACSGGSGGSLPNAAAPPLESPSLLGSPHHDAATTGLYVSDWYGKSVFRFARNSDGTLATPAGSSLVVSYNPGPIAIGFGGGLFVTDEDNEYLYVYGKGAKAYDQPKRQLDLPFVPSCVAVDRQGDEFVGGLTNGYVAVYAPNAKGNATTLQRIALPDGHIDINGVAVDASGNLFVSDTNEISEFATPVTKPTLVRAIIGSGEQNAPSGMALSKATGELYAANPGDNDVLAYSSAANGSQGPDRVITSRHPPLIGPAGVAINGSVLYSTSGSNVHGPPSIFVFDALQGRQTPKQIVTGNYLALPIGVAVGP
jgi:DNA-binding beta-propeller fold protein YncE